ncbi:MAG: alpha/beta fold hydrolase [Proteobacteria bacterium]|nr:alpha/beta fold hydrolase [Pseudomonadota bacterium]MCP4915771.1 alpha/beta fold hydrolase [Pseudomonadota bacterium]
MFPMAYVLRKKGYRVETPTWAYHWHKLPDIAAQLAADINVLAEATGGPVDVVSHSYGGILARSVLAHAPIRRAVLLAPPNQGAQTAQIARDLIPVHKVGWDPFAQILPGIPSELPRGSAEVGIITGGTGDRRGFNPVLDGDNDQTVRVDEARLPGVDDFVVLPVRHTFLMAHPEVQRLTVAFLREGAFPPSDAALYVD